MARKNLLQLVQSVLHETNGDAVNSISDTIHSVQAAHIIQTVFYTLVDELGIPSQAHRFALNTATDLDLPTHMSIDGSIISVEWIKYDKRLRDTDPPNFQAVCYLEPSEFLCKQLSLDSNQDNVQEVIDASGTPLYVYNDVAPSYWTSFDDSTIIFDSFDNTVDDTLQKSKSIGYGMIRPGFTIADGFIPDIPIQLGSLFENEIISRVSLSMKQLPNEKAEQAARRGRVIQQSTKSKTRPDQFGPESGRRP